MASKGGERDDLDIFEDADFSRAQQELADIDREGPAERLSERRARAGLGRSETRTAAGESDQGKADRRDEDERTSPLEPTSAYLRFRVRPSTRERFDTFRLELCRAFGGARINDSHVGRALVEWFLSEAGDRVLAAASEASLPKRPAPDDPAGLATFDRELQGVVTKALARGR